MSGPDLRPSDPAKAEQTVGRLAVLLRSLLDNTTQPVIPLARELATTENYIEIERVRFGGKLRGRVEVPDELRDMKVPSETYREMRMAPSAAAEAFGTLPAV